MGHGVNPSWDQEALAPRRRRLPWLLLILLGVVIVALVGSQGLTQLQVETQVHSLFAQVTTDSGARALYRAHPELQAGYGSEAAFISHLAAWRPRFGDFGPDVASARKVLPFSGNLEVHGSGGAWFAIYARQAPFARLHGIAFGPTAHDARRACQNQLTKTYLLPEIAKGLAAAKGLDCRCPGITLADLTALAALHAGARDLPPDAFGFEYRGDEAWFSLPLPDARMLILAWRDGGTPRAKVEAKPIATEGKTR